jgi:hypothetical protein
MKSCARVSGILGLPSYGADDTGCNANGVLPHIGFPHADYAPPSSAQLSVYKSVSPTVSLDFCQPVTAVVALFELRPPLAPSPAMPEVSVAEHNYTTTKDYQIRLSRQASIRKAVSQA